MPGEKFWNLKKFLSISLIALMVMLVGAVTLTSCKNQSSSHFDNHDTADSALVAQQVEAIVNPTFTSVQEVIQFRQQTDDGFVIDSIFRIIPKETLNNVATIIFKKQGIATKKSIVEEYQANSFIYNNLSSSQNDTQSTAANEVDLNATDLGNRHNEKDIISTSYSYRTDTINGVPVKIQIKKEESYVNE